MTVHPQLQYSPACFPFYRMRTLFIYFTGGIYKSEPIKHAQLPWEVLLVSVFDSAPALSELKNTKNDTVKKQAMISVIM